MLILTTIRRLAVILFAFLVWTPVAYAWSWPVQGPVVQPFSYDESHPYASGQHRGIDIGADATGETVVAPAAGTVSFAGSVPTNGKTVTIATADGYSVTLTHLGSIAVTEGATVAEQQAVGTVGPSGTPEVDGPYVHLGIRVSADPNGYVDPLSLLPPTAASSGTQTGTTASQPGAGSAAAPKSKPASSVPAAPNEPTGGKRPRIARQRVRSRVRVRVQRHERAQKPRAHVRTTRSQHRSAVRDRASERAASSFRRPLAEPTVPRPIGLDAGHEPRPSAHVAQPHPDPSNLLSHLMCNGAAAVFALALVLATSRRRRRRNASPMACAEVLHLPPSADEHRHASRAA